MVNKYNVKETFRYIPIVLSLLLLRHHLLLIIMRFEKLGEPREKRRKREEEVRSNQTEGMALFLCKYEGINNNSSVNIL